MNLCTGYDVARDECCCCGGSASLGGTQEPVPGSVPSLRYFSSSKPNAEGQAVRRERPPLARPEVARSYRPTFDATEGGAS